MTEQVGPGGPVPPSDGAPPPPPASTPPPPAAPPADAPPPAAPPPFTPPPWNPVAGYQAPVEAEPYLPPAFGYRTYSPPPPPPSQDQARAQDQSPAQDQAQDQAGSAPPLQPPTSPADPAATQAMEPAPVPADPSVAPDARPAGADSAPGEVAAANSGRYIGRRRAPRDAKKNGKKNKPRRKAPWWELPALVLLAILIAVLVKTFVVQPFYIPSASMEKTLHGSPEQGHDRILVNKVIYDFRDPHPGDIVVFNAPTGWDDETTSKPPSNPVIKTIRGFGQLIGFVPPDGQVLVKRVIATGGQTIKGDADGTVMVSNKGPNGPFRTLREPYTYTPGPATQRAFGPVTVPKGRLWVMGDHRNDSADSRYHCGPEGHDSVDDSSCDPKTSTVPVDEVIGKAFVVAWPPSHWRTLGTPSTFKSAALAGASDVPGLVSGAVVLPLFIVRRRRRR